MGAACLTLQGTASGAGAVAAVGTPIGRPSV
jgi:hypothetical protein